MKEEPRETWLTKNLMTLLGMAATAYAGYISGTSNAAILAEKVAAIDSRTARIEARQNEARAFMQCVMLRLELNDKQYRGAAPCVLKIPD